MILLNGELLVFQTFPNGETLVDGERLLALAGDRNIVSFKYENDGDLIKLLFVKNFLDDHGFKTILAIYYMPYSRMDRVEGNSVFTLKYVANLINAMKFDQVTIVEPHSDVTPALIDRSISKYPTVELLDQVIRETGFNQAEDYLFFPDAGAQKRYGKIKGYKQLVGFKVRDFQTGQIQKLDVVGHVDKPGFRAIILDDLCSYGGTFLLSAERLKEIGAAEIYLLVGHCENSVFQGKIPQSDILNRVFTTDTILDQPSHDKFQVYKIGGM